MPPDPTESPVYLNTPLTISNPTSILKFISEQLLIISEHLGEHWILLDWRTSNLNGGSEHASFVRAHYPRIARATLETHTAVLCPDMAP